MKNALRNYRFIGKDFILIWVITFLSGMCMRMLDNTLASYTTYAWESKSLGGYMTSVFTIGSVAMAFFSGRLADGYTGMFLISIGIIAVSFAMSLLLFNNKTRARRSPRFAEHMKVVKGR